MSRYRSWTDPSLVSNHDWSFLQLDGDSIVARFIVKFNNLWTKEEGFNQMVSACMNLNVMMGLSAMDYFLI